MALRNRELHATNDDDEWEEHWECRNHLHQTSNFSFQINITAYQYITRIRIKHLISKSIVPVTSWFLLDD